MSQSLRNESAFVPISQSESVVKVITQVNGSSCLVKRSLLMDMFSQGIFILLSSEFEVLVAFCCQDGEMSKDLPSPLSSSLPQKPHLLWYPFHLLWLPLNPIWLPWPVMLSYHNHFPFFLPKTVQNGMSFSCGLPRLCGVCNQFTSVCFPESQVCRWAGVGLMFQLCSKNVGPSPEIILYSCLLCGRQDHVEVEM